MKTKHIFLLLSAMLILSGTTTLFGESITLLDKSDQSVKKESRSVGSFTGISVGGAFDVYVKQTGSCSVEVEASEEIMEYITTTVEGNVLKIGMKKPPMKPWKNVETLKVYVTVDQLKSIDLSGAVELETTNAISGTDLQLGVSGAVEVDLNLTYGSLEGEISGAAEMKMEGTVEKMELNLSGASELDAFELKVSELALFASGASDAQVNVTGNLKISASGACDVRYKGNPGVNVHTSGASDVRKVD